MYDILDLSNTSLETLERGAFWGCTGLTGVIFPATLKNLECIGQRIFMECTGLPMNTSVNIPASVTYVGSEVFYKAPNITKYSCKQMMQVLTVVVHLKVILMD